MLDKRFWDRNLFRNISKETKDKVDKINYRRNDYEPGEVILKEGDPIEDICIVVEGVIKSSEYTLDGKEISSSYFFGDDTIPGGNAFPFYLVYSGEKTYTFNTFCLKKADIVWLPVVELKPIINSDIKMMENILKFVSEYSKYSRAMLRCIQYRKIDERLSFWLLNVNRCEDKVTIPNSQDVLADILHLSRTALNQGIKSMEREGLIALDGKEIIIKDEIGLKNLL